mmetsp:Transcript_34840/g.100878  ORF Transcript_34840/g.100878 Transcript_34840/m.100878 type:complete len:248 (+) Transcript_34840:1741-2484(+)
MVVELNDGVALRVHLADAAAVPDLELHGVIVVRPEGLCDTNDASCGDHLLGTLVQPLGGLLLHVIERAPGRILRLPRVVAPVPHAADPERALRQGASKPEALYGGQALRQVTAVLEHLLEVLPGGQHRVPSADASRREDPKRWPPRPQHRRQDVVEELAKARRQRALHLHAHQRPGHLLPQQPRPTRRLVRHGPRLLEVERQLQAVLLVDAAGFVDDPLVLEAHGGEDLSSGANNLPWRHVRALLVL